jgi:pyruvate dehydrogenase E2 component (dihydrolipoamide acetyltransferase)
MKVFKLPDLGEGLQEAEIVAWHVGVGDHVVADQPLVSVETDKAVVEVPSPYAGSIAKLHGEPGDIVNVGEPLVEYDEAAGAESTAVINVVVEPEEAAPAAARKPAKRAAAERRVRAKATPAVRKLAASLGVDLAGVEGSGPEGAISAEDVEQAAAAAPAGAEQAAAGAAAGGEIEPLRGVRRAMARNMARAHEEVVRATVHDEADVHEWGEGADITMRVIRAVATGCAASPAVNAWFDTKAFGRRLLAQVDLGIAMDTEDGLFVPVLRDIGTRDAADLRQGLERLRDQVKARSVAKEDLSNPTLTLSNFGTLAGRHGVMVLVPPQVAILGTGRIAERVVARDGKPAVRRTLPLSLTTDHRAVTGGEAARFLAAVIGDLELAE